MELSEAFRRRRMVRSYDAARPVSSEAVEELLSAALRAPSAGHTQGVSFLLLQGETETEAYWSVTSGPGEPDRWLQGMRRAPVLVLVWTSAQAYLDRYAQPDKGWSDRDAARWSAPYWYVDAGMASMAALLSAVDAELGACFFGIPAERIAAVREMFGVPEDLLSVGVISVGYPDSRGPGRSSKGRRRPREERLHRGRWSI